MDGEPQAKRQRRRTRTYAKRVELRLTEEQLERVHALSAASRAQGGRTLTLSELLRASLDDGCETIAAAIASQPATDGADTRRIVDALDEAAEGLRKVRTEVRRIGHNVNQIARIANETGDVPDGLSAVHEDLVFIGKLLVALGEDFLDYADGRAGS